MRRGDRVPGMTMDRAGRAAKVGSGVAGLTAARLLQHACDVVADATEDMPDLGFGPAFQRMWDLYLAYSEAGFRAGYLDAHQLLLDRCPAHQLLLDRCPP